MRRAPSTASKADRASRGPTSIGAVDRVTEEIRLEQVRFRLEPASDQVVEFSLYSTRSGGASFTRMAGSPTTANILNRGVADYAVLSSPKTLLPGNDYAFVVHWSESAAPPSSRTRIWARL